MMRRGQALVVVLLLLGVAVTVGLSIVSRSVTEVSVSTAEDESSRALEAAEAGVESALGGVVAVGSSDTDTFAEASFNVSNTAVGNAQVYEVPYSLSAGEVATVDLGGYTGNNVRVCWGSLETAAVELILYYQGATAVSVGRVGYDPNGTTRAQNSFSPDAGGGCNGAGYTRSYAYTQMVSLRNDLGMAAGGSPLILRIRALYNTQGLPVAVRGLGGDLPTQGSEIISTGQAGGSTQKLRVIQSKPDLPLMFDAALFSGTSLIQ